MKTTLVLVAALLAATSIFVVPSAGAVDACTAATGHCSGWVVCYGAHRYSNGYIYDCTVGIGGPYCDPGPCPTPASPSAPSMSPLSTEACNSIVNGGGCPYMLCYHPHYNQWGTVSWCDITLYYPCQYCVPMGPLE